MTTIVGTGVAFFVTGGVAVGGTLVAVGAVVLVGVGVGVATGGTVVGVGGTAVGTVVLVGIGVLVGMGVFVGVGVGGPGGGGIVVATKVGGGGGVLAAALVWAGARIAPATASIPTASGTVNPMVNRLFMQDSLRYALRSDRVVAQIRLPFHARLSVRTQRLPKCNSLCRISSGTRAFQ